MRTDWYLTRKTGTYVVVPAGLRVQDIALPVTLLAVFDPSAPAVLALDADSNEQAMRLGHLGVDDCLRRAGYCVIRS